MKNEKLNLLLILYKLSYSLVILYFLGEIKPENAMSVKVG
jgi:hypothetical protein